MGGPEGIRGQLSTCLTQLVASLLRRPEDAGWHPRWASMHTHTHMHALSQRQIIHRNTHTFSSPVFLYLVLKSLTQSKPCPDLRHQCCQNAGLHVGSNQQHCQSVTHTSTHTPTGDCNFPPWHKGSMLPFQCDFLLLSPHACHLRSLCSVSFAPSSCQQPYGYPTAHLCHPLDSFSHVSSSCWTNSSKCTTQPQDQKTCKYKKSQKDSVHPCFNSDIFFFNRWDSNTFLCQVVINFQTLISSILQLFDTIF